MTWLKLIGYSLLGEFSAVLALLGPQSASLRLSLFLSAHILACVVLAMLMTVAFPKSYVVKRRTIFGFFFGIGFFIPILGIIGLLMGLFYFRFFLKEGNRTEFSTVSLPPFMTEGSETGPGMGEGGAWSRLKASDVPRQLRLKALLAVSASSGQNASRLLQLATGDSDDEIRLLAFNLYDRREKVISNSISQTLQALREAVNPLKRRDLCRVLAFSYWEVVYNDLARDELAVFFVRQSLEYARQAVELGGGSDPALLVLMGRLYLKQGDVERAGEAIRTALEHGVHRDRVIPYLAELAYRRRDFEELKQYFQSDPLLRHKPGIGPVVQFWMG